ncbi:hypothetical protein [Mesoplasma photuris]|uniref:hypothetical protein n=1 Tax=Mesoplasma photuris TaxID=217731 RepID=UPI0004E275C8|nr:hypothetical protein [Mesoplasma photuris]
MKKIWITVTGYDKKKMTSHSQFEEVDVINEENGLFSYTHKGDKYLITENEIDIYNTRYKIYNNAKLMNEVYSTIKTNLPLFLIPLVTKFVQQAVPNQKENDIMTLFGKNNLVTLKLTTLINIIETNTKAIMSSMLLRMDTENIINTKTNIISNLFLIFQSFVTFNFIYNYYDINEDLSEKLESEIWKFNPNHEYKEIAEASISFQNLLPIATLEETLKAFDDLAIIRNIMNHPFGYFSTNKKVDGKYTYWQIDWNGTEDEDNHKDLSTVIISKIGNRKTEAEPDLQVLLQNIISKFDNQSKENEHVVDIYKMSNQILESLIIWFENFRNNYNH